MPWVNGPFAFKRVGEKLAKLCFHDFGDSSHLFLQQLNVNIYSLEIEER